MKKTSGAKPCFLFTVARSGSTPIGRLIGHYMTQHFRSEYLGELFDPELDAPIRIGRKWFFNSELRRGRSYLIERFGSDFRRYSNPIRHRFIEARKDRVFFKAFPEHLDVRDIDILRRRYGVYILYRRDTWQHLLSYVISRSTGLWYERGGLEIPDRSVKVGEEWVEDFFRQFSWLSRQKRRFSRRREIFYEDFLEKGPEKFLKHIGLELPTDLSGLRLPQIQNGDAKEDRIANLRQVRAWYQTYRKRRGVSAWIKKA